MKGIKGIIVHDVFKGEAIFINISAINAVRKNDYEKGDDSVIYVEGERFIVKETFEMIMAKIENAESEDKT
jgi:hypothetical protein